MPRYVAFLRAINVGGHTVKMATLRGLFEQAGLTGVETVIASGNVLFESASRDTPALERRIEAFLRKGLGYEVATFVRTPAELAAIARAEPFADAAAGAVHAIYVGFLPNAPDAETIRRFEASGTPDDLLRVVGREAWWLCRKRFSESTLSGAHLEKTIGMPATVRNRTTVTKLAARFT